MSLGNYFENVRGKGILATSDGRGVVDAAVYARPHFVGEDTCVFLMADRVTHKNLQENPHAAYLFVEESHRYAGKRLYLTKTKESEDQDIISELRRNRSRPTDCNQSEDAKSFVVYFHVDSVRPLVGDYEKADPSSENRCPTCQGKTTGSGHLCVPARHEDETCDWCGASIVDERHLCNEKVKELAYYCNSCGRAAVQAEHVCDPRAIAPST